MGFFRILRCLTRFMPVMEVKCGVLFYIPSISTEEDEMISIAPQLVYIYLPHLFFHSTIDNPSYYGLTLSCDIRKGRAWGKPTEKRKKCLRSNSSLPPIFRNSSLNSYPISYIMPFQRSYLPSEYRMHLNLLERLTVLSILFFILI